MSDSPPPRVPDFLAPARPERARPALLIALAWIAGLIAGRAFGWPLAAGAGICLAALIAQLFALRRVGRAPAVARYPSGAWLLLALGGLGIWRSAILNESDSAARAAALWAEKRWAVAIEGELDGAPEPLANGARFALRPGARFLTLEGEIRIPAPVRVEFRKSSFWGEPPPLDENPQAPATDGRLAPEFSRWSGAAHGDRLRAVGNFRPVRAASNPFTGSGGASLAALGVAGVLRANAPEDIALWPPEGGRPLAARAVAALDRWRVRATDALLRAGGEKSGPALAAITLGETLYLSPGRSRDFQRTGLAHLFSVSGLHAGIVAAALYGVLILFGLSPRWRFAGVMLGVLIYTALTGFRTPSVRTAIMIFCLAAQVGFRHPVDLLSRLAAAAFTITLLWPRAVFQPGFQFSFTAVFALIVFGPFIGESFNFRGARRAGWRGRAFQALRRAAQALLALALLQAALTPLMAHYYQMATPIAPLANLVIAPLATAALLLGAFLAGPGLLFPGAPEALGPLVHATLGAALDLTRLFACAPGGAFALPAMAPGVVVLWEAVLFGGAYLRFGRGPGFRAAARSRFLLHALALAALAFGGLAWRDARADSRLRVTFIDIGQGDCALLELPGGARLLLDAGPPGPPDLARLVLEPVFRARRVEALDLAIASHADADHIGGFPALLDVIPARAGACPPGAQLASAGRAFSAALHRHSAPVWNLRAGQSLVWRPGGARLDVLNPLPEDPPDAMSADRNSHSLVLRLQWRRATLLFTGDADRAAESRLLDRLAAPGLRSQVLKVSHHGSEGATSAQWLAAIRPRVAVISCGRQNRYGHPHRNALARLAAAGARIHRTDLQGALVVESDGKRLWITPCAPPTFPPDH